MAHCISLLSSVAMAMLLARYSPHTGTSRTGAIFISLATESDTSFLCTRLTLSVLADAEAAVTSAQLLLLSQASVFHTAAYTESLFGALSLAGMCCLYCWPEGRTSCRDARSGSRQSSHHLEPGRHLGALAAACVAFTLASCVRSNGKLGSPFLPLLCAYHSLFSSSPLMPRGHQWGVPPALLSRSRHQPSAAGQGASCYLHVS